MSSEVFRPKINLITALSLAAGVHFLIANVFVFTFPNPVLTPKPMFVFLGSFLRSDDFMMSVMADAEQQQIMHDQKFNLDIRSGSLSRELNKPSFSPHIGSVEKSQYRPQMSRESGGPKMEKTDDLGIDLAPIPTVRMRMDQHDQD